MCPVGPLLGPSDFPKLPARLPRFIPRDELDRLMEAVEALDDPFQRTALHCCCDGAVPVVARSPDSPSTASTPTRTAIRDCGFRSARPTPSA